MFPPEGEVWYGIPDFDLLANNITVPGLSPLYPAVHCTENNDVCQLIIGEAEVNAASSVTALVLSPQFDLTSTYFLIAGIAGVNPHQGTLGDVTFARYAVQAALQYEFDAREIPANFSTGYFPQGSTSPSEYPQSIYGTEAFEVNAALRELAVGYARQAVLNDSTEAQAYRANYGPAMLGSQPPSVRKCDVTTSDTYFSGTLISEALGNYTTLVTNGTGVYCTTAQEDNATLEALLRGAVAKLVDFSRIIIMRTASDFDRPYPGESDLQNLIYEEQGGIEPALTNIYLAGIQIVNGILNDWTSTYLSGIPAPNYIGDILGTLGGTPDFGNPNFNNNPVKRDVDRVKRGASGLGRRRLRGAWKLQ
ncbi:MAG: hypothetical protein Q9162_006238 [Coniocarpon cinnabarinum]